MAVENVCFESNMAFGPYPISVSQDCYMGSVFGIEDGFSLQEPQFLDQQKRDNLLHLPLMDSSSTSLSGYNGSLPRLEMVKALSSELEKQRIEMDWFLQLESSKLWRSIMQSEARQKAVLMQRYESRIKTLMLQKDQALALARTKTRDLQESLIGAEMEVKAWEKRATEKEATVSHLSNKLNQVKERQYFFQNQTHGNDDDDDAVSFCDSSSSSGGERRKGGCKLCQVGSLCVVFFPCRHLCCCKSCDGLLLRCLVCNATKEASLEVFLV